MLGGQWRPPCGVGWAGGGARAGLKDGTGGPEGRRSGDGDMVQAQRPGVWGPFPVLSSDRASCQRASLTEDDRSPLSLLFGPGTVSALGIEQGTQQRPYVVAYGEEGHTQMDSPGMACGWGGGSSGCPIPCLTARPPAGSWAAGARLVASLPKASAPPCSYSMTSRRCGSRCECARHVGPGCPFPPSSELWLMTPPTASHWGSWRALSAGGGPWRMPGL